MGPLGNEVLNHIGQRKFNGRSMVVFLNMLLLKYYHAHNIHHCPLYPISTIGSGFCYLILKGKFLFIFNIFGGEFGYTQLLYLVSMNGLVFLRLY